eukprot:SAG22_NODE_144_length_17700_cov_21.959207_10_plen_40_part_00
MQATTTTEVPRQNGSVKANSKRYAASTAVMITPTELANT